MIDQIPTITEVNLTKDIDTGEKFLNTFKLVSKLGTGHNGKVYLGCDFEQEDKLFAIKEISKISKISILNKNPHSQLVKIQNEIDIMKLIIEHPKILKLHKVLNDSKFNKIFLILEYCSKGELKFGSIYKYSNELIKSILRDVTLGLEYLHNLGIIHRDIKPSNLLMNDEKFVKISDFGISLIIRNLQNGKSVSSFGTPAFLAPELCNINNHQDDDEEDIEEGGAFKKSLHDGKIDIWALGISIYCLKYGTLPFSGKNEYELFNEIINNEIDYDMTGNVYANYKDDDDSDDKVDKDNELLIDLLKKLLEKDPKKRISIKELKKHKFLIGNLDSDQTTEFEKFNETLLSSRGIENVKEPSHNSNHFFKRNNSLQRKFKSIFKRKSSIVPDVDIESKELNNETPPIVTITNLTTQVNPTEILTTTSTNSTIKPSSSDPLTVTDIASQSVAIPSYISSNLKPERPPIKPLNSLALSSNSLNLNTLLKSKKDVPDYLDDSTFYQTLDSDDDNDDDDDSDENDSDDGLYNDVEDTLSFRIGPKRVSSSLQVRTVNEYLDI